MRLQTIFFLLFSVFTYVQCHHQQKFFYANANTEQDEYSQTYATLSLDVSCKYPVHALILSHLKIRLTIVSQVISLSLAPSLYLFQKLVDSEGQDWYMIPSLL